MATPCWPAPVSAMTRRLAHVPGEQRLAEHVVDLVRAGVVEVLALEQHPRAAGVLGEAARLGHRAGPPGVRREQAGQLGLERVVVAGLLVRRRELVERGDQRLGDEPAAVGAEVPGRVRDVGAGCRSCRAGHRSCLRAGCAPAATRSATAERGSRPVTRDSPTRTASAPARAYSMTSCGPRTPDSAIRTTCVGDVRRDPGEDRAVDLQGAQVAGVDADDVGARVDRAADLLDGVALDERRQAERLGALDEGHQRVLLECGDDEQSQVGPVDPGLPQLVARDDEVLAQHRHVDRATHRDQVVEAAAEAAPLGEDADDRGAAGLVVGGERRRGPRSRRAPPWTGWTASPRR